MRRRGALWKVMTLDTRQAVVTVNVEAVDEQPADSQRPSVDDET